MYYYLSDQNWKKTINKSTLDEPNTFQKSRCIYLNLVDVLVDYCCGRTNEYTNPYKAEREIIVIR